MFGTVKPQVSPFDLTQQQVRPLDEKRRVKEPTTIGEMKVGSWGWAVDWAMAVANDGSMWLRKSYTVESEPGGTAQLLVRRASRTTWHVDTRWSDELWQPEKSTSFHNAKVSRLISMTPKDAWGRQSLMVTSVLPLYLRQMTVETLRPGQAGWSVPWAHSSRFSVDKKPGGTAEMMVRRRRNGEVVTELRDVRERRLIAAKLRRNGSKRRRRAA